MEKQVNPIEDLMQRTTKRYLNGAAKRYSKRVPKIAAALRSLNKQSSVSLDNQQNKQIDFASLFARFSELKFIKASIGKVWESTWLLTGSETFNSIYSTIGRQRPLDFIFLDRPMSDRMIDKMAKEIQSTTEKNVRRIVTQGIKEGIGRDAIASNIKLATAFSEMRSRRIAQTETTRSINAATNQSYVRIEEQENITILKEWISSRDGLVRPTHEELDSMSPIPVKNDFTVDGFSAPSPASFGEPEMDINCRCTIAPVVFT
tara:strand:+ start:4501 stop:5283 length:783 start_codon:yes stop_codon:yes gene_type:complete